MGNPVNLILKTPNVLRLLLEESLGYEEWEENLLVTPPLKPAS
jgi:hypothetical protein